MTPSQFVEQFLRKVNSPHQRHFLSGYELHIDPIPEEGLQNSGIVSSAWIIRVPPAKNDERLYPDPLIQRIGTSGWNWMEQRSEHIGIDFDVKGVGHKGKTLTPEELAAVEAAAGKLPYVGVYTSKGGHGRHFYVRLAGNIKAATRADHRLVAYAVLARMSADADFDFSRYADCFGGLLWLWDRDAKSGGFQVVKEATENLALQTGWEMCARQQAKKATLQVFPRGDARKLQSMVASSSPKLDEEHHRIRKWCLENGWPFDVEDWNGRRLIHVHTAGLKAYAAANPIRGRFNTVSSGTDPSRSNAFAFVLPNGGLIVRRFGNAAEAEGWEKQGEWHVCRFNVQPSYQEACRLAGATLDARKCFVFTGGKEQDALTLMGINFTLPELLQGRDVIFKRDGQVIFIKVREHDDDPGKLDGWRLHRKWWEHTLHAELPTKELYMFEELVRHTVGEGTGGEEWLICDSEGRWQRENLTVVERVLEGRGASGPELKEIVGYHAEHSWTLTRMPFAEEYPPGVRRWNRDAPRLAYEPHPGIHPHWDSVFSHAGRELDVEVRSDDWCQQHGIRSGADYLRLWSAILFREPRKHLPFLFFWSEEQDSGKSTFHRAHSLLFEDGRGCAEIKKELTKDDFNDLLEGCVLAYVEEIDLSQNYAIYDQVKNLVDTDRIKLRGIYDEGRMVPNYAHWIYCANSLAYLPIPPSDTRIVAMHVQVPEKTVVWQDALKPALIQEASAFLHTLMHLPLPKLGATRLYLPTIETASKRQAMQDYEDRFRGWYYDLRDLAANGQIVEKTAKEILHALRAKSTDETITSMNEGVLAKRLDKLKERLLKDGFTFDYTPGQGRRKPTFSIRQSDEAQGIAG